jgi:multidrug resistance efflux pump
VFLSGSVGGAAFWVSKLTAHRTDLLLHEVHRQKLQLTIVERGSVEAAKNYDINCQVKAKSQQSNVATSIKWVIDDGTVVKKGDKLIEMDDSGLQDTLTSEQITLAQNESAWIAADQQYKIDEVTAITDVKTKESAVTVAKVGLDKWIKGDYVSQRTAIESTTVQARSDLSMWEERADWSDRMSRPGRQYVTVAQAEADAARTRNAQIVLDKAILDRKVLEYENRRQIETLKNAIDAAEGALEVAKMAARANIAKSDAARKAAQAVYEKQLAKVRDIESEIKKCVIYAPQDGMVVYYTDDKNRWAQNPAVIAQGENVKEGQKLMRIPDLSKMVVNTRIHEAMVSKVRPDRWEKTGFSDLVEFAVLATDVNPLSRAISYGALQDLEAPLVETYRKAEMRLLARGQSATIRCNAFPDKLLHGHIKTLAAVASQQDFFSSDVKVYQTMISIDESLPGLKPGLDAVVTMYTDISHDDVLAMPLQAIMGSIESGQSRTCFVMTPKGPVRREIKVGISNDTMAEVLEGIEEGDVVVLNPHALLNEKERQDSSNNQAKKPGAGRGGPGGGRGGPGGPGGGGPGGGGPGAGSPGGGAPGQGGVPGPGGPGGRPGGGRGRPGGGGGGPPAGPPS